MAEYSIISDVSAYLLKQLREKLCPEPVQSQEGIQLASPADKKADFQLGLFLYDINSNEEARTSAQIRNANNTRSFPPRPLGLSYMLYLNSKAQIAAGAETEQRILGRAIQVLSDNPIVDISAAHSFEGEPDGDAAIAFPSLSFDDKSKVWAALNLPYQAAVFFTVSPVLLVSERVHPFVRVHRAEFSVEQRE